MRGRAPSLRSIIGGAFAMLVSSAFIWTAFSVSAFQQRIVSPAGKQILVADNRPAVPLQSVRKALLRAPMNPALVNHWLVASTGESEQQNARAAELLSQLGYRHSPAQINLMYIALQSEDYAELSHRVDAMFRRNSQPEQMTILLATLEADSRHRPELIKILAAKPRWIDRYLFSKSALQVNGVLSARRNTLTQLGQASIASRAYYAFAAREAWERRNFELAKNYWIAGRTLPASKNRTSFPFEWELIHSPDIEGNLVQKSDALHAQMDWNGRGAGGLLRRGVMLQQQGQQLAVLRGVEGVSPDNFMMKVRCRGASWRVADVQRGKRDLIFTQPSGFSCAVGELELATMRPTNNPATMNFAIDQPLSEVAD